MKDTLQYIIVIIAVIVAIINKIRNQEKADGNPKNKKPVLDSTENKKTSSLPGDWEKWFKESEEEVQPVKQEPVVVAIHPQTIHSDLNRKNKSVVETNNKEQIKAQNIDEHSNCEPEIQLNSIEEVRKAIIYSEIIQRKY